MQSLQIQRQEHHMFIFESAASSLTPSTVQQIPNSGLQSERLATSFSNSFPDELNNCSNIPILVIFYVS